MTGWGFPIHPVKEIENTSTTNVVVDICQFDDKVPVCFFLIILTSNALSKVTPRFPRLSINFALCFVPHILGRMPGLFQSDDDPSWRKHHIPKQKNKKISG